MLPLVTIKKRSDFLRLARSNYRWVSPGFVMFVGKSEKDFNEEVRVGFTASKKVGKAVQRNRAKRRLRALCRDLLPQEGVPGWDHVLIARTETVTRSFGLLQSDLKSALRGLRKKVRERES